MAMTMAGLAVPASQAASTDEQVAQQIAQQLKVSGRLKDYRVGVKYKEGVAWLLGTVTSEQQKKAAELIAGSCEGVVHVVSKLEIEGGTQPQPTAIPAQAPIQTASASSPLIETSTPEPLARPLAAPQQRNPGANMPVPYAFRGQGVQAASYAQPAQYCPPGGGMGPGGMGPGGGGTMGPAPMGHTPAAIGQSVSYDNPQVPNYAWPSYAAAPNYAALTYPKQYSASAWPYIGPFYPYPQVPLGWRKVTLEWDDGWWFLDFKDDCKHCCW